MKKSLLRNLALSASRPGGGGLTLLLLLVVLVPSVCLLWFMNQAVQNERVAYRQKLLDLYQGQLALAGKQLENYWSQTAQAAEIDAGLEAPARFAQLLKMADAAVCFDDAGKVAYPNAARLPPAEPLPADWEEAQRLEPENPIAAAEEFGRLGQAATNTALAARAFQAQARCLIQARQTNAALEVLTNSLAQPRFQTAADAQGRLVAPAAELMALELMAASDPRWTIPVMERLRTQLLDYKDGAMPAAQRRFLMRRLEKMFPTQARFPSLPAEDLAARYVESNPSLPPQAGLLATPLPGVWQFPVRANAVLLFEGESLRARLLGLIGPGLLAGAEAAILPPGKSVESFLSMPAGPSMSGWQMALCWKDRRHFDTAADARIASLLWTGVLAVAAILALGLLAAGLLRRQMAVTQLKNDLVANVTHELKTPLSSIRLLVDTLLNSPALEEKTAREYLQLIARENLRLSHLIDNFLAFSRIERNKYAFDFQKVPSNQIVDSAAAAVRERFNVPGCQFTVQAPPDLPPVVADAGALVTALLNLLDNAYKYSGEAKSILLTAAARNRSVAFAVQDNGIGLAPAECGRIFRRFYQVDRRLSRTGSGCGLGLSIVKFIVAAHHGEVRVESQPERGSTFIITLPAAEGDRAGEAQA